MATFTLKSTQRSHLKINKALKLDCLACGPNLNPNYNVLGHYRAQYIIKDGQIVQYNPKDELKSEISKIWWVLPPQQIQNNVNPIQKHGIEVIKHKRSPIEM